MSLVDAMFRDNLKRVTISKTEGKTEKSRGFFVYIAIKRMRREMEMLNVRNISIKKLFNGTIMMRITKTTLKAMRASLLSFSLDAKSLMITVTCLFVYKPQPVTLPR
jgi:hypothetical protein